MRKHHHMRCATASISFHGKRGDLARALHIFESLQTKNAFVIGAILKACHANRQWRQSLQIYASYSSAVHDDVNHLLAIKACAESGDVDTGKRIHGVLDVEHSQLRVALSNALIAFYAHCSGDLSDACCVFHALPRAQRSAAVVHGMMKALYRHHQYEQILGMHDEYNRHCRHASLCIFAIKACIRLHNHDIGQAIIDKCCRQSDTCTTTLKTCAIEFYAHFHELESALRMFESIGDNERSAVSVSASMTACMKVGQHIKGLQIYDTYCGMRLCDDVCHNLAIKACMGCHDFKRGEVLIQNANLKHRSIDNRLKNTLIAFYGQFGRVDTALRIFESIAESEKDIVSMTAMMDAYCHASRYRECIRLFQTMDSRVPKDAVSYAMFFKACTQNTEYHVGHAMHRALLNDDDKLARHQQQRILQDVSVQCNLIHMYGKCGMIDECRRLFEDSPHRRDKIEVWNAMLYAFGRNGAIDEAMQLYDRLQRTERLDADTHTFKVLLSACNHCGDVEQATRIWNDKLSEEQKYDALLANPFIDCLCRKGLPSQAKYVIVKYSQSDPLSWTSLLHYYLQQSTLSISDLAWIEQHIPKTFDADSDCVRLFQQLKRQN